MLEYETPFYLYDTALLRQTRRGDLLTIKSAGAYGMSMASRYNLHDLPGAVYGEDIQGR